MLTGIYPGSFDPVHNGHLDIALRASKLFDKLIVGVYDKPNKSNRFSGAERTEMFRNATGSINNIEVVQFSGLVTSFAREMGSKVIVRGLRAGFDFETEFEMALMWRNLDPELDIICLMSSLKYQFIYSSRIKEVAKLGGNITGLVPDNVIDAFKLKFK